EPLAGLAAELAPFLVLDLGHLLRQQLVDHRAGQDLVLRAHHQPDRLADAARQHLLAAAARGAEAAGIHLQRTDRLERGRRQQLLELGEIVAGGETEESQVAEEHAVARYVTAARTARRAGNQGRVAAAATLRIRMRAAPGRRHRYAARRPARRGHRRAPRPRDGPGRRSRTGWGRPAARGGYRPSPGRWSRSGRGIPSPTAAASARPGDAAGSPGCRTGCRE